MAKRKASEIQRQYQQELTRYRDRIRKAEKAGYEFSDSAKKLTERKTQPRTRDIKRLQSLKGKSLYKMATKGGKPAVPKRTKKEQQSFEGRKKARANLKRRINAAKKKGYLVKKRAEALAAKAPADITDAELAEILTLKGEALIEDDPREIDLANLNELLEFFKVEIQRYYEGSKSLDPSERKPADQARVELFDTLYKAFKARMQNDLSGLISSWKESKANFREKAEDWQHYYSRTAVEDAYNELMSILLGRPLSMTEAKSLSGDIPMPAGGVYGAVKAGDEV